MTNKKLFVILAISAALSLNACGSAEPGPASGYSGPATIDQSYRNSSKRGCKVVVKLPDGRTDTLSVGRRTTCNDWPAGKSIRINNGALVK